SLEFPGPNGAVRPGCLQPRAVGHVERQCRPAVAVVEALNRVRLAVPTRVVVPPARNGVVRAVTIRGVGEDVAGVVSDDVEYDVDPLFVRGLDELAELLARPEMRINVEEILDPVAVVGRLERDLAEDGADPQGGDAEPPKIAELALQPLERTALPAAAGAEPHVVIDPTGVFGAIQRRRAVLNGAIRIVLVAVSFLAIGEAIQ